MQEWLKVVSSHQEFWLPLAGIVSIETPGQKGKPNGWSDSCAAAVSMQGRSDLVVLNVEQWRQLKQMLRLE